LIIGRSRARFQRIGRIRFIASRVLSPNISMMHVIRRLLVSRRRSYYSCCVVAKRAVFFIALLRHGTRLPPPPPPVVDSDGLNIAISRHPVPPAPFHLANLIFFFSVCFLISTSGCAWFVAALYDDIDMATVADIMLTGQSMA
jgi:hypothetical protein